MEAIHQAIDIFLSPCLFLVPVLALCLSPHLFRAREVFPCPFPCPYLCHDVSPICLHIHLRVSSTCTCPLTYNIHHPACGHDLCSGHGPCLLLDLYPDAPLPCNSSPSPSLFLFLSLFVSCPLRHAENPHKWEQLGPHLHSP